MAGKHSAPISGGLNSGGGPRAAVGFAPIDVSRAAGYAPSPAPQTGFLPSGMGAGGQRTSDFSRAAGNAERYTSKRSKKRRRVVLAVLVALVAAIAVGAVAVFAYVSSFTNTIDENLHTGLEPDVGDALVVPEAPEDPYYILLLGTDQSLDRDENQSTDGIYRTDTIILARVDPATKKVTLVSIPRDTQVDLGENGVQKINAAYAFGGAKQVLTTVSQLAGVDIAHFVLVDMDGLVAIVDSLGGIEIEVPYEINDEDYTGHLDAGWQTLDGWQTLIFARARHAYDDVGDGDHLRTANQRAIIGAIARKVLDSDLAVVMSVVERLSEYVQTDLSVEGIVNMAAAMKGMNMETDLYSATAPIDSVYEDGIWKDLLLEDEWRVMMGRVKQGLPPTDGVQVDEGTGIVTATVGDYAAATADAAPEAPMLDARVVVKNGTGADGVAARVSDLLTGQGVDVVEVGNADTPDYPTTLVIYNDDRFAAQAQLIAQYAGGSAAPLRNDGSYELSADILVVVGNADV